MYFIFSSYIRSHMGWGGGQPPMDRINLPPKDHFGPSHMVKSLGRKNILTNSIGIWHLKGWHLNDDFPSGLIVFVLSIIVKLSPTYFLWRFPDFTIFYPLNLRQSAYMRNLPVIGFTLSPLVPCQA